MKNDAPRDGYFSKILVMVISVAWLAVVGVNWAGHRALHRDYVAMTSQDPFATEESIAAAQEALLEPQKPEVIEVVEIADDVASGQEATEKPAAAEATSEEPEKQEVAKKADPEVIPVASREWATQAFSNLRATAAEAALATLSNRREAQRQFQIAAEEAANPEPEPAAPEIATSAPDHPKPDENTSQDKPVYQHSSASTTGYKPQYGAFSHSENAEKLKRELEQKGQEVHIEQVDTGSGTLYRVRGEAASSKSDAASQVDQMKEKNVDAFVVNPPQAVESSPAPQAVPIPAPAPEPSVAPEPPAFDEVPAVPEPDQSGEGESLESPIQR